MEIVVEDGEINVKCLMEQKCYCVMYGLSCFLVVNMIIGVIDGFVKELELVGVGYCVMNIG